MSAPAAAAGEWVRRLEGAGALRRGHFRLSSGLHSPVYVQCALLLEEPRRAREAGAALAAALSDRLGAAPGSVLSPALGGVLVGHETAAALGVPFRFTERTAGGAMALRRGFRLAPGETVVVVEDVITTGRSTRETVEVAREHGARVVAVAALLDRTGAAAPFDVPFVALATLDLPSWAEGACPLCAEGSTPEKPGSRPDPA